MQLDSVISLLRQRFDWNFQLGVDLVNDRARTTGALVVHRWNLLLAAGLRVVFEDNDLGILSTEFNHRIDLGMEFLDGKGYRRDFLYELGSNLLRNSVPARPGHEHPGIAAVDTGLSFHPLQKLERLFRLLGFMALVVLPQNLVGLSVDHNCLDGGRADIKSDEEFCLLVMPVMRMPYLLNRRRRRFERCNLDQLWALMIVHEVL